MARRGPRPAIRLLALLASLIMALAVLGGRLVQLQVMDAPEFEALGSRQRVRRIVLPARRGAIMDRDGRPLALSVESRSIYSYPRDITDPKATARAIAPLLGLDAKRLTTTLRWRRSFLYLARKVEVARAERILALGLPGIGALPEIKRVYPSGPLAGQVLGFVGTDNDGLAGLEYQYDGWLAGTPGEEIVEQDPRGREIPQGHNSTKPPEPGGGLLLTIDRDLQFAAEQMLGAAVKRTRARNGVALVLNPKSGDILAMANWPPMEPGSFASTSEAARRNRVVTDSYEPGSVNKVITAAAALESGMVTPSDLFTVPDNLRIANKRFRDFEPHRTERISYGEILARSSNIGTIKVALRIGGDRVQRYIERFGLGRRTNVGFPGEANGIVLPLRDWYRTSIGTIPIGQGIAVTPLQMAMVYATIANDGVWVRPRLVRARVGPEGETVPEPRGQRRRVIGAYTAAQLRAMLLGVVEHGTGRNARIDGYLVGGKTGTARKPRTDRRGYSREIVTTFIGMVPVDAPRLVVFVALDNPRPRFAAVTAAPAFNAIARFAIAQLGVPPSLAPGTNAQDAEKRR